MEKIINTIDLTNYLDEKLNTNEIKKLSIKLLDNIHKTGILIIRDPRVKKNDNEQFINMMERYYSLPKNVKYKDVRKESHYQVGITPENIEKPLDHCDKIYHMINNDPHNAPKKPKSNDPKERFMWRICNIDEENEFSEIEVNNIIPKNFPNWEKTMNMWAKHMLNTINSVSELLAISLDLDKNYFINMMKNSDTLLAPTGINILDRKPNDIIAGYHYDVSYLTIHGKSRYPGLYIWTKEGKKVMVNVPDGCLIIQAGKQIEYLTGGYIKAGYHEVLITNKALNKAKENTKINKSTWRVSSTMFAHFNNESTLKVIDKFKNDTIIKVYPEIKKGKWLINELNKIYT